jgi:hypothetical protein
MPVEAQNPRHQAAQSKSSQSHPVIATKMAARYPVLTTRSFHHSACAAHPPVVRNQAAHAVSGHEAQSEYRRHKFNELDHEKPPVVGEPQYRAAVRQKYDGRALMSAWT